MYGTVAKFRVKSGNAQQLVDHMEKENREIPGAIENFIYQLDEDTSVFYLVVMFADKKAYVDYAESAISNERYQKMLPFIEGEPEWHDGEVVYHHQF